jgi:class 3 adenylate cyclase/tRNA A-37 threonylcarbamoyl transferase component Bud32
MATTSRRPGMSLGTRIFLVSSLLIALSVGGAVAVTFLLIRGIARDAARDALQSSSMAQSSFQDQGYERLKLITGLLVTDPTRIAYIAESISLGDPGSILDLLLERQEDFGYDFAIVLDPQGKVLARTDRPEAGEDLTRRPLVARVMADLSATGVWQERNDLYYAVALPIIIPGTQSLLGFLVTGFEINEAAAKELNQISGADVAFVAAGADGPEMVATTLPAATSGSLISALRSQEQEMGRAMRAGKTVPETEVDLDGEPWMALQAPLLDAQGKPVGATVALASVRREMAAYRQIETALLGAGLTAMLLAPLLSYVFARRTLAPVRRLVASAEAARQGNYDQKIASGQADEIGTLAHAFDELLADLREKRDMEAYVTELSRNLPEPAQSRAVLGAPQIRDVLLLGIELRRYARASAAAGPQETLDRLAADLEAVSSAVTSRRGQIEAIAGHRVVARFEGEGRGLRAMAAAALILGDKDDPESQENAPAIAMAAGRVVSGPVSVGEQLERTLVGLPVQMLDSLLREATPGELMLSRDVHKELKEPFEQAGYRLAERRGILSPQPLYTVTGTMAMRLTSVRGAGGELETVAPGGAAPGGVAPGGAPTLSGIAPGALMGQRFEVLSVLGSGGMGIVYKARDRELDDLVALKMMRRELWGDRVQIERLKSELKLARKITHPNVLRTYDFGEIDGIPYISMEYVRGVTLRYLLDQTSRLPYSAGLRLAKQLCAGLGAAHAVGVLHRDIKPENLILEPTGNAKLMDFGIARPVHRLEPGQTQAGFIVGTPQYLSPEQLQGHEADTRADIYSCGMVLYEVFTGALPFSGKTAVEIALKHLNEPPAPPRQHWPEMPVRLEEVILRCLKKDPDERYRSVEELSHDLEALSA